MDAKRTEGQACSAYEGVFNLAEFFESNIDRTPLFIVDPKTGDTSYQENFELEPHGLLQRVRRKGDTLLKSQSESVGGDALSAAPVESGVGLERWSEQLVSILRRIDYVGKDSERFADAESWEGLVRAEYHEGYHRCIPFLLVVCDDRVMLDRFLPVSRWIKCVWRNSKSFVDVCRCCP